VVQQQGIFEQLLVIDAVIVQHHYHELDPWPSEILQPHDLNLALVFQICGVHYTKALHTASLTIDIAYSFRQLDTQITSIVLHVYISCSDLGSIRRTYETIASTHEKHVAE
jgi:hypothetical protein